MFAVLEKGAVFVRVGATARVDWSAATPLIIPSAIRVTLSPSGAETMALGSIMRVRASCVLTRVRRRVKLRRLRKSGRRGKERRRKEKKKKKEKEWKREAVTNDRRWIADPNLESRVAVSKIRPREKRVSQSLIASSSRSCVIGTSLIAWYSFSFLLLCSTSSNFPNVFANISLKFQKHTSVRNSVPIPPSSTNSRRPPKISVIPFSFFLFFFENERAPLRWRPVHLPRLTTAPRKIYELANENESLISFLGRTHTVHASREQDGRAPLPESFWII